jgi:hypothetical protein
VKLGITDWSRSVAQEPDIALGNRYFEQDPTNLDVEVALLTRPGLKRWKTIGSGPIRQSYSQPGAFDEAEFVVSGNTLYRIDPDETETTIGTLGTSTGGVSLAATDTYLFVADGDSLKYYTTNDYAKGTLTVSGAISAGETVVIGTVHYEFAADVTTGTPDGTSANPWLVALGGSASQALQHLFDAIGNTGVAGTDYNSTLTGNPDAAAVSVTATVLVARAIDPGTGGNSVTTTETLVNGSWGGSTMSGGGGSSFASVAVPDNDGIVSVASIAQYVICVVAAGQDKNGRFYWIEPGETTIDPLNYATNERSPDSTTDAIVAGDQVWFPGQDSIEVWYPAGDPLIPFLRQQGRLFERGAWPGTVFRIGESMMLVDSTGSVWQVTDAPRLVSTPGIAQRIREAINADRAA